MKNTLSILGAGRVGRALGKLLRDSGWKIASVSSSTLASAREAARFIGGGVPLAGPSARVLAAEVVLICVPDDALASVARELALIGSAELHRNVILHTSGALDSSVLAPLREFGASAGSIHPLQSFSGRAIPNLQGRLFVVEGDPAALRAARRIARSMGGVPHSVDGASRALYHAAAAMAAGHVLAVVEAATRAMMTAGLTRRESVRALLPLTRQVLSNYEKLGPAAAWTGPLARRDFKVVEAHLRALERLPEELGSACDAINKLAARVLADDSAALLARLAEFSAGPKSGAASAGGKA